MAAGTDEAVVTVKISDLDLFTEFVEETKMVIAAAVELRRAVGSAELAIGKFDQAESRYGRFLSDERFRKRERPVQ